MDKKVVFSIAAVVTFIVTAILVDIWPSFASLFLFLGIGAGWLFGYNFAKAQDLPKMAGYETELATLNATVSKLKKEKEVAKVETKKSTKKPKE